MKHKTRTKALSWLLSLALMLSLLPGMGLTAYADGTKAYAAYDVTTNNNKVKSGDALTALQVTFNDKPWYIIADNSTSATEGTVTLLAADTSFGMSKFGNSNGTYNASVVKNTLDAYTASTGSFANVADAIVATDLSDVSVTGAKLYLLSTNEANELPANVRSLLFTFGGYNPGSYARWWLRSPAPNNDWYYAACMYDGNVTSNTCTSTYGVRPALQLDLSKVTFDSTKVFKFNPHEHNFTNYTLSSDGATITATCTKDGCPLDDGNGNRIATLTIAAPESLAYSGTAKAATVVNNIASVPTPSIVYTKDGSPIAAEDVKEPGTYTASITLAKETTGSSNDLTASVTFTITNDPVSVTLTPPTIHGKAALLDDSYNEVDSLSKKAGDTFILSVSHDDGYDYNISFTPSVDDLSKYIKEFTSEEYKAYTAYIEENDISVSGQTDLFKVTMPGTNGSGLNVAVTTSPVKDYTILYRPSAGTAPDAVWCKFQMQMSGQSREFTTELKRGATMADGTAVWSVKIAGASGPTKIAFAESADAVGTIAVDNMTGVAVKTTAGDSDWTGTTDKHVVIGGNARTVMAVFMDDSNEENPSVTYKLAVCSTDGSGNVTAGTVTAPTVVPTPADKSIEFDNWKGFVGVTEKECNAGGSIDITDNVIFYPVWKPKTPEITLNYNNGTTSTKETVDYNTPFSRPADPTKSGYAFDDWTVGKDVTESGTFFPKGATFDFDKGITTNLGLTAQWKHVHSYTCYKISDFGNSLEKYQKYENALHISACGCGDIKLTAHEFDSAGKCVCGYEKLTETVSLSVSYGQWSGENYTQKMTEPVKTAVKDQEVSVYAPDSLGENMEFSKWQYSIDGGTNWKDLSAYMNLSFIIPCDMQVRALYINPVTTPQVDLSARFYDNQTVVDGKPLTMKNTLFHMNYKLPDGYTFVDAGIRLGDNTGICYYELKEVKQTAGEMAFMLGWGILTGGGLSDFLTDQTMDALSGPEYYYDERENSVLNEAGIDAAVLAKYMYESTPINVKADPIYWEAKAVTKGMSGSMETIPPLRFAQKNGGNHYIYGIAYLRYKDKDGKTQTIYTDALPATVKNMPNNTVTKTGN